MVQRGGACAGCGPRPWSPPRCTKRNSQPINGHALYQLHIIRRGSGTISTSASSRVNLSLSPLARHTAAALGDNLSSSFFHIFSVREYYTSRTLHRHITSRHFLGGQHVGAVLPAPLQPPLQKHGCTCMIHHSVICLAYSVCLFISTVIKIVACLRLVKLQRIHCVNGLLTNCSLSVSRVIYYRFSHSHKQLL